VRGGGQVEKQGGGEVAAATGPPESGDKIEASDDNVLVEKEGAEVLAGGEGVDEGTPGDEGGGEEGGNGEGVQREIEKKGGDGEEVQGEGETKKGGQEVAGGEEAETTGDDSAEAGDSAQVDVSIENNGAVEVAADAEEGGDEEGGNGEEEQGQDEKEEGGEAVSAGEPETSEVGITEAEDRDQVDAVGGEAEETDRGWGGGTAGAKEEDDATGE